MHIKIVTTGFIKIPVLITVSRYFSLYGKLSFPSFIGKGRWSSVIKQNMVRDFGLNLSITNL